jgi:hypothetical protein
MSSVTVNITSKVQAARTVAWVAQAAAALARAIGHWRAPQAPTPMVEAARVRALAQMHLSSDPGFAADLFAAADRHEYTNRAR